MEYVWYGVSRSIEGLTSLQRQHACLVSSVSLEQGLTLGRYQKKKKKKKVCFWTLLWACGSLRLATPWLAGWLAGEDNCFAIIVVLRSLCKYIY